MRYAARFCTRFSAWMRDSQNASAGLARAPSFLTIRFLDRSMLGSGASFIGSTDGITRDRFRSDWERLRDKISDGVRGITPRCSVVGVGSGILFALANASFARLLLHGFEFLPGGVDGFLFFFDLLFEIGVVLVPLSGIAQPIAGVGILGYRPQAIFPLRQVEFMVQGLDLGLLRVKLVFPFIGRFLAVGGSRFWIHRRNQWRCLGLSSAVRGLIGTVGIGRRCRAHDAQLVVDGKVVVVIVMVCRGLMRFSFAGRASSFSQGLGRRKARSEKKQDSDGHPNCTFHLIILPQAHDPIAPAAIGLQTFDFKNS